MMRRWRDDAILGERDLGDVEWPERDPRRRLRSMTAIADMARPDLPRPTCRVKLVCGPPAAGKTTYVRAHARADDIVIDFDLIAREMGFGLERSGDQVGEVLAERNARMAALAHEPAERLAWVVINAPSHRLREWWRGILNAEEVVLLLPDRAELLRRIRNDPERQYDWARHYDLVNAWMMRERYNDPGIMKGDCDAQGMPTDPLHPWNRGSD